MKNKIIFGLIIISLVLLPFVVSDYNPGHLCSEVNTGETTGDCEWIYSESSSGGETTGHGIIEGTNTDNIGTRIYVKGMWGQSSYGIGTYGNGYYGIYGTGTYGVYGMGSSIGVYGVNVDSNLDAIGVKGESVNSYGVYGKSTNSYGVYADCVTYGCYGFYTEKPSRFGNIDVNKTMIHSQGAKLTFGGGSTPDGVMSITMPGGYNVINGYTGEYPYGKIHFHGHENNYFDLSTFTVEADDIKLLGGDVKVGETLNVTGDIWNDNIGGIISLAEHNPTVSPITHIPKFGRLYVDSSDSKLYFMDDAGTPHDLTATGTGSSLWTQSGTNIYYNNGDVGIGTDSPNSKLNVKGGGITVGNTLQMGKSHSRVPKNNIITTVDSYGDVGAYSSITIGVDGLPIISYFDHTNDDLKVAHCNDATCTTSTITILDNDIGDVPDNSGVVSSGMRTSIAIGVDGLPIISYYHPNNGDLQVVHCGDRYCSSSNTIANIDSPSRLGGLYNSIAIGVDGLPIISYYEYYTIGEWGELQVVHCGDRYCSSGNVITTLDSLNNVGTYTSITIGADGLPIISYYYVLGLDLKVAHCGNIYCNSGNTITVVASYSMTGAVGGYSSITIGVDGLPIMSYYDYTSASLKVTHCGNIYCNSGNTMTNLDPNIGFVGSKTSSSITIGVDGLPIISYRDNTIAHCSNTACTSAILTTIYSIGEVGSYSSITIGVDGLPIISSYDETNGYNNLKVIQCSNEYCLPYWTRR